MPYFLNPFAKHDVSEFPGVLVPLQDARRHSVVTDKYDEKADKVAKLDSPGDAEREGGISGNTAYTPYTLEGLRAEIDEDLQSGGVNSAYDRM